MTCLDDLDVLDYIDEGLAAARMAEVREHLDGCATCLGLVAQLTGTARRPAIDGLTFGRTISSGGMGVVVEAFDTKLERRIALKLPRTDDPLAQRRFEREVKVTARLQHPAIVPVYAAGTLGDGEPYYAMRLVEGDSLDVAIDRAASLTERLALVRAVTTVAGAIAYAHSQGILHRDIKPANVLVGKFGEVVVIDWGLAHMVNEADESAESGRPLAAGSPGPLVADHGARTVDGAVVGTPAYMAPEQARGEPVDERADVFALGALLYHVLRGAPPARGRQGDLATEVPALPRDLVAIVAEAMAPDPADRYRTAAELVADLERFQAGQLVAAHDYSLGQLVARWIRRHRAVITVSALALVALISVGAVSVARIIRAERVADDERTHAVASRGDAEDLLDFLLVDLRDKLVPLGKLELLDTVAQKARGYYERRTDSVDPADHQNRAVALQNIGDVLVDRGDLVDALGAYRSASVIQQTLLAVMPGREGLYRALGVSYERIGEVLAKQGDDVGALASYRAGFTVSAFLAAAAPADLERQRDLSISHKWIGGILLAQGNVAAALVEFRAALAIAEKVAGADPTNARGQRGVSVGHSRVGDALLQQHEVAAALVEYRASMAIDERLAAMDPTNAVGQRDLSLSHQQLGDVLRAQGDGDKALIEYRAARAISEQLIASDPTNATWLRDVETSRNRSGEVLEARADLPGALAEFRAALMIAEKLAATDPTNTTWLRDLSVGHEKVAEVLVAQRKPAEARAGYEASLAIAEKLAAADPADLDLQRDLMVTHVSLAETQAAANDRASAITHYRAAVAIGTKLSQVTPPPPTAQADLAEVQRGLAALLRN
ncbi:MAG: protein kinase [Myxococcales bacterium]|nr:protein kinase [Myxococcales bacterium]